MHAAIYNPLSTLIYFDMCWYLSECSCNLIGWFEVTGDSSVYCTFSKLANLFQISTPISFPCHDSQKNVQVIRKIEDEKNTTFNLTDPGLLFNNLWPYTMIYSACKHWITDIYIYIYIKCLLSLNKMLKNGFVFITVPANWFCVMSVR